MSVGAKGKVAATGALEWAKVSYGLVREDGLAGAAESARTFRSGLWRLAGLLHNYGTPIYDLEWDVLVVLDACRADLMAEVATDFGFESVGEVDSLASASPEWMEKNFTGEYAEELAGTAYVTANPYSRTHVDREAFLVVDEVWDYAWDEELGTVTADAVTDRAVAVHREWRPERTIVHYMQPHHPFVPTPLDSGMDREAGTGSFGQEESVWRDLRLGRYTREEVWSAYRENLEYALEHVDVLLDNVDADTVAVTADHGNAFGEHGMYGHPIYVPIEPLKRVPWCVTSATDSGTYEPRLTPGGDDPTTDGDTSDEDAPDVSIERKLRDLGYL